MTKDAVHPLVLCTHHTRICVDEDKLTVNQDPDAWGPEGLAFISIAFTVSRITILKYFLMVDSEINKTLEAEILAMSHQIHSLHIAKWAQGVLRKHDAGVLLCSLQWRLKEEVRVRHPDGRDGRQFQERGVSTVLAETCPKETLPQTAAFSCSYELHAASAGFAKCRPSCALYRAVHGVANSEFCQALRPQNSQYFASSQCI